MQNIRKLCATLTTAAITLPCAAYGATAQTSQTFDWYAETGLGYDSNVHQAPRSSYMDYAVGATQNQTVVPQRKSGFFVPFKAGLKTSKHQDKNTHIGGGVTLSGRKYFTGVSNADEVNLEGKGGLTFDLSDAGNKNREAYAGLVLEKHERVYVDHDSGAPKTTTAGANISNRYNYTSIGIEGEYKDELGNVDYSVKGQYLNNDYDDPLAVSQLDHSFTSLSGDLGYKISDETKLNLSAGHSTLDYSARHARSANGVYSSLNPLLNYSLNEFGATLRTRASQKLVYYIDFDYSQRTDGYVNYNDYKSQRFGGRVLFDQGQWKARAALHHWKRDYSNAFAYDIATQPVKNFSGNLLSVKAEFPQAHQMSYWAEVSILSQDSSDKRYAYDRKQLMVGARWDM